MKCMDVKSSKPSPRAEVAPGVWLDARRAVYLEAPRAVVVADLHWGYAESHRRRGNLVPWWGDDEIHRQLHALLSDYSPAEMIWLGDSLHAVAGRTCAERFVRELTIPLTILRGNHDRTWQPSILAPQNGSSLVTMADCVERAGFWLHHGDRPHAKPGAVEMIGHHHPAYSWNDGAGGRVKLPALIVGPTRWILPAFSPWASGTPWQEALQPEEKAWAIAPHRIFAVPPRKLA